MIRSDVAAVRVGVYAHREFRRQFDWAFVPKAAIVLAVLLLAMGLGQRSYAQTTSSGLEYAIGVFSFGNCSAKASSASVAVTQLQECLDA